MILTELLAENLDYISMVCSTFSKNFRKPEKWRTKRSGRPKKVSTRHKQHLKARSLRNRKERPERPEIGPERCI